MVEIKYREKGTASFEDAKSSPVSLIHLHNSVNQDKTLEGSFSKPTEIFFDELRFNPTVSTSLHET